MNAIGANLNFDPCVDILENWRNTIVNTRAYGTTADDVIKYTIPFVEGQRESGILTAIKHFPGDGTEERDQHLVLGVNELSPERWDESFGRVYAAHIANGVEMIMAGHIALPYYSQKLNPELADADIMPPLNRFYINTSEVLRSLSGTITPMLNLADSLYVSSVNRKGYRRNAASAT